MGEGAPVRRALDVAGLAQLRNELAFVAPPSFDVELTNACNLRCRFCPREALTRPRGTMAARTLEAVLDHIPADGDLFFCGLGESLLHPGVVDAVRLGKRRGRRRVGLVTNAALLTPDLTRRLLDAGLDTLQVSFNGVSPEVYERVMVGGRMEVALAHVDRALELGRGRLRVDILFTDTKLNHGERDALVGFWRARGVSEVMVTACHSRGGFLHDPELLDEGRPPALPVCGVFAAITFVDWRGEVLACCQDLPGAHVLGSLVTGDFEAIRRGKQAIVRERRWFPMCGVCTSELRYSMLQLRWTAGAPAPSAAGEAPA